MATASAKDHSTAYVLPTTSEEYARLDKQHEIFRVRYDDKLFLAPLDLSSPNFTTLDVGTGSGVWAMEFARRNPRSTVVGLDQHPVKPWVPVPRNCRFVVCDAEATEQSWSDALGVNGDRVSLDYVHGRSLSVGIKNWPALFKDAFAALKPGGWLETQETELQFGCEDGTADPVNLDSPSALIRWNAHTVRALHSVGIDPLASRKFPAMLEEAGFVDIGSLSSAWPIGPWTGDAKRDASGRLSQQNTINALQSTKRLFQNTLKWDEDSIQTLNEQVEVEMEAGTFHVVSRLNTLWARKPLY